MDRETATVTTGIEIDARYASIARERIRHHTSRGPLFDEEMG
jgi:hypothetical protein